MDRREKIEDLLRKVSTHYKTGIGEITIENRDKLLQTLDQENEELASTLKNLLNSWISYDYLRSDKELRMKMKDVWDVQVSSSRIQLDRLLAEAGQLLKESDIGP